MLTCLPPWSELAQGDGELTHPREEAEGRGRGGLRRWALSAALSSAGSALHYRPHRPHRPVCLFTSGDALSSGNARTWCGLRPRHAALARPADVR